MHFAGISVPPLANSLSTTMERFTITSLLPARMTRLGRHQLFPISAAVSRSSFFSPMVRSFSGSKCVSPPKPDAAQKMIVSWNPDYPPAHNEKITYKCNAGEPYNRQDMCHPTLLNLHKQAGIWFLVGHLRAHVPTGKHILNPQLAFLCTQ